MCPCGGMVDAADSKSALERGGGSSPSKGTRTCGRTFIAFLVFMAGRQLEANSGAVFMAIRQGTEFGGAFSKTGCDVGAA